MGSEPSQWKWQVEAILFPGPYCHSIFHALVGLWLVHRSTYQGTSIDQVKNLNEALFILLCFCGWGRLLKLQLDLVGPNNQHEVWWKSRGCQLNSYWQGSQMEKVWGQVCQLGSSVPSVGHVWFSVSCTVECLLCQIRILIQWWNETTKLITDVHFHFNSVADLVHIHLKD